MKTVPRLLVVACVPAMLAIAADPAPAGPTYLVETKVLSVGAGAMGAQGLAITADVMTLSTNGQWHPGGKIDAAGDLLAKLEKAGGVDVLSAPKIVTRAGQAAKIEVGRQIAYLVPETNVCYRVRHHYFSGDSVEAISNDLYRSQALAEELNPGIQIMTRTCPADGESVKVELGFTCNLLVAMSELPGTHLKMGRPIITTRKINTTVGPKLGEWVVVGGAQKVRREADKREENIIVFLRVTKVEPDGSSAQ